MTTMADSRHPYERATGGKGDRDIRTNPIKYRASMFWKRSICCDAHVFIKDGKMKCASCNKITSTKDQGS